MATENGNEKGVSPQRSKGGARRWYGAARGLAIVLPFELVLLPMADITSDFFPLAVAFGAALICLVAPAQPHIGKSARVGDSALLAWFFAVVHLLILGFWVYFSTGFFGLLFNAKFKAAVKDADRIVVRDGNGLWSSSPDKEPVLFGVTNKAEIAAFNDMFKFARREMSCKCSGYPGIDWWRDGQRIAVAGIHHNRKLRMSGIGGDLRFTAESKRCVQEWLETHCGLTPGDNSPRYRRCIMARARIESEALDLAKTNDGKKPTMDDLRDEFKKNGKEFPSCPAGGEYSLTYGEDGTPEVKCTAPRHD
ncbi:MAG: hypothetical protein IKU71_07115 [Kiritimatiellae bacterium]|nr:hypothetical protein [Kiritimatiellia bacterium]